ncbi:hypothetical protein DFP73DRAFT_530167 [Morchella snyderi]|nr:hypothetical protein DFP73DRAFT_530167 [Morchella snyderi]
MCQVKHCQFSCGHFTEECLPTSEGCRHNPCKVQTVTSRTRDYICSRCKEAEKNQGRRHGHCQHKKKPTIFPPGHDASGGQPPDEEAKFRANQLAAYRAKQDLESAQAAKVHATMDPKKHKKAMEELTANALLSNFDEGLPSLRVEWGRTQPAYLSKHHVLTTGLAMGKRINQFTVSIRVFSHPAAYGSPHLLTQGTCTVDVQNKCKAEI